MKSFWFGLTAGILIGGVAVSLLAPQTGRSTRKKLRHGLEDFGDDLSDAADYLKDQAERLSKDTQKWVVRKKSPWNDIADTVQSFTDNAKTKVERAGTRLM